MHSTSDNKVKSIWIYLLPAIIWTCLSAYAFFNNVTSNEKPWYYFPHYDKVIHTGIFGGFAFLYIWGLKQQNQLKLSSRSILVGVFFLGEAWAVSSELIQYSFIEGRSGDWKDLLADTVGVLLGIAFYKPVNHLLEKIFNKSKKA